MSSLLNCRSDNIVAHVDLDCFYVQCERSLNPMLCNKPCAVVQYNPFGDLTTLRPQDNRIMHTNGSIIAVSYEARVFGVKRNMRGYEAKKLCPDIILVQVPVNHSKADLTIYRNASNDIVNVLMSKYDPESVIVEKASIDEMYLDVTKAANDLMNSPNHVLKLQELLLEYKQMPNTIKLAGEDQHELKLNKYDIAKGHQGATDTQIENKYTYEWLDRPPRMWSKEDQLLIFGTFIVQELRKEILVKLHFTVSAGISNNKMLAKIGSSMHKPNKVTILPTSLIIPLMQVLPMTRVPGFNGKLGVELMTYYPNCQYMGDISRISRDDLMQKFHDDSLVDRILNAARGIDHDVVVSRSLPKSISNGKSFRQKNLMHFKSSLTNGQLKHWIHELVLELNERCEDDKAMNNRQAKLFGVGVSLLLSKPKEGEALGWSEGSIAMTRSVSMPRTIQEMEVTAYNSIVKIISSSPKVMNYEDTCHITYLSLKAESFVDIAVADKSISSYFQQTSLQSQKPCPETKSSVIESITDDSLIINEENNIEELSYNIPVIAPILLVDIDNETEKSNPKPLHILPSSSINPQFIEDIDPETLQALPLEIRAELLMTLNKRHKRKYSLNESPKRNTSSSISFGSSKLTNKVFKNDIRSMFMKK